MKIMKTLPKVEFVSINFTKFSEMKKFVAYQHKNVERILLDFALMTPKKGAIAAPFNSCEIFQRSILSDLD